MVSLLAWIAIIISAIGLFGMAEIVVYKKIKEIGIRKVNGAKAHEVLVLINQQFVIWIIFSFILASPMAWIAMNNWLKNFAYRTELSWWVFAAAGVITLAIALFTVSWQSWRAARRNPVEALRYE